MSNDDRQRLRREAVAWASKCESIWQAEAVLAMESLLVEAEELKEEGT